jgi:uncharacterized membrane protein
MIEALSVAGESVASLMTWTHLVLDAAGTIMIVFGTIVALAEIPDVVRGRRPFVRLRLDFARYLTLALEFQLASDILETAISPTWTQLGQLASIAAIRTALNFFLAREMKEEWAFVSDGGGPSSAEASGELPSLRSVSIHKNTPRL